MLTVIETNILHMINLINSKKITTFSSQIMKLSYKFLNIHP